MARILPTYQEFMDLRNGTKVGVTRVIMKSTSDQIIIPDAYTATAMQVTGTNVADFYLNTNGNAFSIDSATIGDEFIVVSVHKGQINFGSET